LYLSAILALIYIYRVYTGLENPGKSLHWKKRKIGKSQDWKVLENSVEVLESPGINFLNLQLCF
jgi:hypothetical protein